MAKNKTPIPDEFKSIEEVQSFWDEHSTADYWYDMQDVDIKISTELRLKIKLKKLYKILAFTT